MALERQRRQEDEILIAGVDEAGRGPLAGPVVAAAVVLPSAWIDQGVPPDFAGLNDSKQLRAADREFYFNLIQSTSGLDYAVAEVGVAEIDRINILRATHRAMLLALQGLRTPPEHVLVDGLRVSSLPWPQTPVVKGDARSYSIAAASVLAKVTRDHRMLAYDRDFPAYGFAQHKGYGTAAHLRALHEHGPCPIHRRSFAPLKSAQGELFPSA